MIRPISSTGTWLTSDMQFQGSPLNSWPRCPKSRFFLRFINSKGQVIVISYRRVIPRLLQYLVANLSRIGRLVITPGCQGHQKAPQKWSQQHMMTCLASVLHQTFTKLTPRSRRLLLGPPPAPFLIPKWCQNDVRELQIQPELLSGSHFPQLLLTNEWFICHMEFGRALHSIKALL